MGTAFAGIVRTPLTSVIMIFEITRDYSIIVPLMISNLIAIYISSRLQREPIYEALAAQDGIHLPTGAYRQDARRLRISAAMRVAPEPLPHDLDVRQAVGRIGASALPSWPVADANGLIGMLRTSDLTAAIELGRSTTTLQELILEADGTPEGNTRDIDVAHVHGDQPLGQALARMGETRHTVLPVVSRGNIRLLLGIVTLPDVLRAYGVERLDQLRPSDLAHDE